MSTPAPSEGLSRTNVRRLPERQARDRTALDAVLDAALVAHVAVPEADGSVYVVPFAGGRDGDRLLIHGSTGSRAMRVLASGVSTCATITLLDGVVVARSQFESSMHYRCAMILGRFEALEGEAKATALAALSERLLPGVEGQRPPSPKELRATAVLALPLREWSVKVSAGQPGDLPEDLDLPLWAGVVPLRHVWGEPRADQRVAPLVRDVPQAILDWPEGRA